MPKDNISNSLIIGRLPNSLPSRLFCPCCLSKFVVFIGLALMLCGLTTAQASVSGTIPYSTGDVVNPLPIPLPEDVSISVSFEGTITGTAIVTGPGGYSETINVSQSFPSTETYQLPLGQAGTYSVSENFHVSITGTPDLPIAPPVVLTDDGTDGWTFNSATANGIATLQVTCGANISITGHSDNLNPPIVSGMTVSVSLKDPLPPGGVVFASADIGWYANTSMSVEGPPETGTIQVQTNLGSASFTVSGPEVHTGNGTSETWPNAIVGSYTIVYNPVGGYETPPSETQTLTTDGTITFIGNYVALPAGTLEVRTNLAEASFTVSGIGYNEVGFGTYWVDTLAPPGNYTVFYNDVDGYESPPSEAKTLVDGGITTFVGDYVAIPTGTIQVQTNIAEAGFTVSGPKVYKASGMSRTWENAPVGEYTITYEYVAGYETPSSETKTLNEGEIITFIGNYVALPTGTIVVETNLMAATFNVSGIKEYSGGGKSQTWMEVPIGDYTVAYGAVAGYETPPSEMQTLTAGGTLIFAGNYVLLSADQTGTIQVQTDLTAATFTVTGPATYTGGGTSQTWTEAPLGDYTIVYGPVDGYETPPSETKTLTLNSPLVFTGAYEVASGAEKGGINVQTNLEASTFTVTGPAIYTGGGTSQAWTDTPLGEYTIVYHPVTGYDAPPSESQTLTAGGSITFVGNYRGFGKMQVQTNRSDATFAVASSTDSYSGSGTSWAVEKAYEGEYTITYNDIDGLKTPLPETKTLIPGGTISFSGIYRDTGTIEVRTNLNAAKFTLTGPASYVYNGTGKFWTEKAAPIGIYVITYGDVLGYATPSSETLILTKNGTTEFRATYNSLPGADIYSVEVSGSPANLHGVISVSMTGTIGGTASFSIENVAANIPMTEGLTTPGIYTSEYNVPEGVYVENAVLTVKLVDDGQTATNSDKKVSIFTTPWDINNDGVVDSFDLESVSSNLGKSSRPELDVNGDGAVSMLDVIMICMHFGEEYVHHGESLDAGAPLTQKSNEPKISTSYLLQNYPNPSNPGTWIPFMLSQGGDVNISIYSPSGQLIRRLNLGYRDSGVYVNKSRAIYWDGTNDMGEEVASGVYFYHIQSGEFSAVRKMLISR